MLPMTTIKGKNMHPIGSLFFHLKVDPLRIENSFKGIKKLRKYLITLKSSNFDATTKVIYSICASI